MEAILEALRQEKLPHDIRKGVRRNKRDRKVGACLGYVEGYPPTWRASRMTRNNPELAKLICQYAKDRFPEFKFSTVQINKGGSALHVDILNHSRPSMIVSLGEHTGGELWQYPDVVLDIKHKLSECDGRVPHITLPYEGERYSLVYFTLKATKRPPPPPEEVQLLLQCGFDTPQPISERTKPRVDLLEAAAGILMSEYGLSSDYIGDYTNTLAFKKRESRPFKLFSVS